MTTRMAVIDLPLRSEWTALITPTYLGKRHEANPLRRLVSQVTGHIYAYDFVRLNWERRTTHPRGIWRHVMGGVSVADTYTWAQPVYAPFSGVVVATGEGWPDKLRLSLVADLFTTMFRRPQLNAADIRPAAGNYVMIESDAGVVALLAHLRLGSLRVDVGDNVTSDQVVGEVGHSGTSYIPHLHFQLMDRKEALSAQGIPFCFRHYERWNGSAWHPVQMSNPRRMDRIRLVDLHPDGNPFAASTVL